MRDYPQFEDLGLVDDDRTEDLRPNSRTAPVSPVLPAPAGAALTHKFAEESR
jgi:hypothetical protein